MKEDKVILDGTINPQTVDSFFEDYLAFRKVKTGTSKGVLNLSSKTMLCFQEALANEKKNQAAVEPLRFSSDFERT